MSERQPAVSVVVATHNRAARLGRLLDGLRAQSLSRDRFEVVVVDDGSTDETAALLEREHVRGDLDLRAVRRARSEGPASARDDGWRAAAGDLIAFTDDDCVPERGWLQAALGAAASSPGAIVQGRTEPDPTELDRAGPFTRTISVPGLDPAFHTCNIVYPRSLLERIGGFDTEAFDRSPGGEDSDLAWRAIGVGARVVFAADVGVHHAVERLGPMGKLRVAARWTTPMRAYARHRDLRRTSFTYGIFWKPIHYLLLRAVVGALLPSRWHALRNWLIFPYLRAIYARGRLEGGGLYLAPYFVLHDLVELFAVARAAIRYRTPML